MNNEIPSVWLWVSGIFFLLGIFLFVGAMIALYKMMQLAQEMKPKIETLAIKVEGLTDKLDKVADRVEETMTSVKLSVDGFGGSAQGILGSVETFTKVASSKLEGITPIIAGAMAAYKIFLTFKSRHDHAKAVKAQKALPTKIK